MHHIPAYEFDWCSDYLIILNTPWAPQYFDIHFLFYKNVNISKGPLLHLWDIKRHQYLEVAIVDGI